MKIKRDKMNRFAAFFFLTVAIIMQGIGFFNHNIDMQLAGIFWILVSIVWGLNVLANEHHFE